MTHAFHRFSLGFLLVLCLFAAARPAAAQSAQGVGVGIKGGLLFNNLDFGADQDLLKSKTGLVGGLFVGGNRGGLLGVEMDIFYARKNGEFAGSPITFDMLEVPLLLRLNVGSKSLSGASLYGLVGPAMDFRLKSDFDGINIVDFTKGYDVNLVFGGGIELTRFLAEVRYNQGLRNIAKDFSQSDTIKTRSFALLIGVRFN